MNRKMRIFIKKSKNGFRCDDEISATPRGSIKIGKITMQRKGGDAGRPSANCLQFKIDPTLLFNITQ